MNNILIVEDNEELLKTLKLLFELEGLTTHTSTNASLASKYCDYQSPLYALVDINLPDKPGDKLALELKRNPNIKKIVLMSAREDVKEIAKKLNVDYISKPFSFGVLLKKFNLS